MVKDKEEMDQVCKLTKELLREKQLHNQTRQELKRIIIERNEANAKLKSSNEAFEKVY